jgi:egghead protein (zeste-white 4 protein)
MQTDRPKDRASARLNQLRYQRLKSQNGRQNEIVDVDKIQTMSMSISHVSKMPESACCDESTMRMGTVTQQEPVGKSTGIPFLSTMPVPVVPSGILPEVNTPPYINSLIATPARKGVFVALVPWFYRCFLICATGILTLLLLRIQAVLDHIPLQTSIWRTGVQWAELTWLAPVPLAIILWLGWFIFAEAIGPNPIPISVPFITAKQGIFAYAPAKPVRLVFRFVTKGDNIDVLRDSVVAVHKAFANYQHASGPYHIEIISDCPVSLNMGVDFRTRIYVVPPGYTTRYRSRFKARALTYLQEQVRPQSEDWYIYLDEESLVDEKLLAGLYRFIQRSIDTETHAQYDRKKHYPAGLIGQGAILYQGGNWFFRGADALRTADDLGRFRLQYALGKPLFGIHGSFIVIRGIDDARLSFDVGSTNSITEDTAWALRAWAQGFRFAWVDGYLHEQPPQRARDFVRQRSRWLSGIRAVLGDTKIPIRYRLCLGVFTGLWQLAFLPFLVAVVALFVHASPFVWMRLPADFAWATFTLAYLQGIDVQGKHSHPFLKKMQMELQWKRIVSWLLVLCSIWYSLLEAAGVIYSLRPKQGFFVIQKQPSLAAENKVDNAHTQPYPQPPNTTTMERRV